VNQKKATPRDDYRQQESQRSQQSASLSQKFPELKSLTIAFGYFSPEGNTRNREIKYTVNPAYAKSVFRLDCLNDECVCGDFDLSEALTRAVAGREATVSGELRCEGWISKSTIDRIHCYNILRYRISLEYAM